MRYSYLELYVHLYADSAEVRYGADDDYEDYYASKWETAKEGISFYFEDQDDMNQRLAYIKIPEEHYLFNYGILENAQGLDKPPFSADQYRAIEDYARKHLAKVGIPMTIEESLPDGETGGSGDEYDDE